VGGDEPYDRRQGKELTQPVKAQRILSPIFAALVVAGILVAVLLDQPWAGIAGWALTAVSATAWLITVLWLQRSSIHK
jgi:hypothetical protein